MGRPIVTVAVARMAEPSGTPVSELSPDGTSTARMGVFETSAAWMSSAASPRAGPRNPVPKRASIIKEAEASDALSPLVSSGALTSTPAARASRSVRCASPVYSDSGPMRSAVTGIPLPARYLAATRPSPPLFPMPVRTTTGPPRTRSSSRATCATRRPALSMSFVTGMPYCSVALRSSSAICADVTTRIEEPLLVRAGNSSLSPMPTVSTAAERRFSIDPMEGAWYFT